MVHRLAHQLAVATALSVALLMCGTGVRGQSAEGERIARVERGLLPRAVLKGEVGRRASIAERMAYHGIPAMSMAVIDDGQIVWARAYGLRDRDSRSPATVDTLFQAASLSKPVSALGAVLLVQQERIDLNSDVRRWLRSWTPTESLTLRQLLSHSAGLTVSGFAGYPPGSPLPTVTQILQGVPPANSDPVRIDLKPGSQVRYSGGGYVVVQQLIMDVTQQPFDGYMQKAVFSPLGMTRSHFEQPLSADHAAAAASGYRRDGVKLQGGWMVQPELAAAGLWTTPTDLARLVIEVQDAAAKRPTRTLYAEMGLEMLTGRIENVGLGFFLTGPNGPSRRFTHSGRNSGFDARLVGYKNGRQGAVVMINRNNNGGFIDEVLESVAREYGWPDYVAQGTQQTYVPVAAAVQAPYAGVYDAAGHPQLVVVFEEGKLFARAGDAEWFRLYPTSDTEFFATDNDTRWRFVKSADGKVSEIIARTGDVEVRRRRVQ